MEQMTVNPVCRFCGQAIVTDETFETMEAAVEWASKNCDCDDAKLYKEIENSKENARCWLKELGDKQMDIVCNMIAAVGFEVIDGVTIKLDSLKSISFKKNGQRQS